jgi:stearoyl-CoA desaturase (Delta-9 desaturase)
MSLIEAILVALGLREGWGWIPSLIEKLIASAVRRLPESERPRWMEEWKRHALDLDERRLYALLWALELRFLEVRKLRATIVPAEPTSLWTRIRTIQLDRVIHVATFAFLPLLLAYASAYLWTQFLGWTDLAIFLVMYVLCGFGVAIGYHRLLTHRAFCTSLPLMYLLAALGSMAVQGPVLKWVENEQRHHRYADRLGDPHSPHVDHGPGLRGVLWGIWHAHAGWLWQKAPKAQAVKHASELRNVRGLRLIDKAYPLFVVLSVAVPSLIGLAVSGSLRGALMGLLWGGLIRIVVQNNVIRFVDSFCHFFGRRRFATYDHSRNLSWLALPSLGEAWHNNHHAFPNSAVCGLRVWEVDPAGMVIHLMRVLGLAWDVVAISTEEQQTLSYLPEQVD